MITEAILSWIVKALSLVVNPIISDAMADNPPDVFFPVPMPLLDYVQAVMTATMLAFPLMLAYWVWRQIKA